MAPTSTTITSKKHPATSQEPRNKILTFDELAALEPRLLDLLKEAQDYHDKADPSFCPAFEFDEGTTSPPGMSERIAQIVGPDSGKDGYLGTDVALWTAHLTIYKALPKCAQNPCPYC